MMTPHTDRSQLRYEQFHKRKNRAWKGDKTTEVPLSSSSCCSH